jgi:hypothetical protein
MRSNENRIFFHKLKGCQMPFLEILSNPEVFSEILYEKMKRINAGIEDLELYEFRYGLDNLLPEQGGWASVILDRQEDRTACQRFQFLP